VKLRIALDRLRERQIERRLRREEQIIADIQRRTERMAALFCAAVAGASAAMEAFNRAMQPVNTKEEDRDYLREIGIG